MKGRQQLRKEHVHFKPETYIGSYSEVHERTWIIENGKVALKTIAFIPAVLNLVEELIANAIQHGSRHPEAPIQLSINEGGTVTVTNEGLINLNDNAVPTVQHLLAVFGEEEIGSELYRRGRGAKLVNMFCRNFYVEMGSHQRGQAFKVIWSECLGSAGPPKTMPYDKCDYTKFKATLDLPRFRLSKLSQDFLALIERRAWDVAAINGRKVIFNSRLLPKMSFPQYAAMFMRDGALQIVEAAGWRVALGPSEHGFQQLSFVNSSFWTRTGGTHVSTVVAEIASKALQRHHKRLKDPAEVMQAPGRFTSGYVVIVDVAIEQPQFNFILRDSLLMPKLPGSFRLSDSTLEFLESHQALKAYREMARKREQKKAGDAVRAGEAVVVPRLQDAGKAGASSRCTLLLVENEATRQLMAAGLECVSREYFGIYTLRGKLPNVRENKHALEHHDFVAITKALGLSPTTQSVQDLRYGSVLIVADQDAQGVAVKGLLLNFFEFAFPWTLRSRGFVKLLVAPVVRVVNSVGNVKEFLSERDFHSWSSLNSPNEWTPTRFGSIGSMNPLHMRDLFADRKKYSFAVTYNTPLDDVALALPYGPDIDARRKWLEDHRPETVLDYNTNSKAVPLREFVDRELAHVFYNEAARGLPSVIDGLTIAQRRALNCLLRLREGQEVPLDRLVAQAQQEYHEDGEMFRKALIAFGQSYTGANNLGVVDGVGQFGTRMGGGKDHAPSRHLRVALPPYLRLLFPVEDDELLQHTEKQMSHYVPILPLMLINGFSQGTAFWKSSVQPHRVLDVIEAVKEKLSKGKAVLQPGWEGFKGTVVLQKNSYMVQGIYELRCTRTAIVKELPPFQGLREYRAALEGREEVEEVRDEQRAESCLLVVRFREGKVPRDLAQYLQVTASLQESPAVLIGLNGKPRKYNNPGEILEEHLEARLKLYERRKEAVLARLQRNVELLSEKIRFIRDVLGGEFSLADSEQAWRLKFVRKGYKRYQDLPRLPARTPDPYRDFEHLERLPMNEFSERRVSQLRAEKAECEEKLGQLRRTEGKDLWLRELAQFEERWRKWLRQREQLLLESQRRAENFRRQEPSEPSPARNHRPAIEFEDISLDSQACADLEVSRTQGISEEAASKPKPKFNGKRVKTEGKEIKEVKEAKREAEAPGKLETAEDIAKAQYMAQRKKFEVQIREMERKNAEFQERVKREAEATKREAERARRQEMADKQRSREAERLKREQQQQQRVREAREKEARAAKDKLNVKREANSRREALGRHAMEIGKKVEEEQRQKQERQKSDKSNRNHLPSANGVTPRITVPYHCDSSTFQVTHVERKRFSSRDIKMDQAEINRIHADIRRQEEQDEQRANRNNTCIELD